MTPLQIVGRSSSLFTRMPLIFAEELALPWELVPIHDMAALGPEVYAGNPALKLPILRMEDAVLFGTLNICRAIDERAERRSHIVWPEEQRSILSRNAQELVWDSMAAQVQLVLGTMGGNRSVDNGYLSKARAGLGGALRWLDARVKDVISELAAPRRLSVFEVSLFCLVDHLVFRETVSVEPYPSLLQFSRAYSERPSARRTAYRFDTPHDSAT